MNRINLLHISLVLMVILLLFLIMHLSDTKRELVGAKESYAQAVKLSTYLSGLKNIYDDKEKTKRSLERILEHASLKSAKLEQEIKTTQMIIRSHDIDITALNVLMSQLLNNAYTISTLKITKFSQTHASIYIEITW